jgi:hypothetical protein
LNSSFDYCIFNYIYLTATIPHGMRPGDTFIVEIPPNNNVHNDNNITKSSFNTSQIPTAPQNPNEGIVAIAAEVKPTAPFFPIPVPLPSSPITMQESRQDSTLKTTSQYRNTNYNHNRNRNNNQKHMLVKVPVGVAVGSTIHVQIPGENRMMAAQVPSGVSEFHVAYDPMPQNQQQYSNSNNTNGYGDNHKRFNSSSDTIGYGNGHGRNNNVQNDFRRNSNLSHSRGGGNGLDFVAPVLTGAALMGGAGYLISQHQNNQ